MRSPVLLLAAFACAAPAAAGCRLSLVLALDVSASVDQQEYDLQAQGMGRALVAPPVAAIILENPDSPIAISAFFWSGPGDFSLISDWVSIRDRGGLEALAARIAGHPRRATFDGRTAIGSALAQGGFLQATAPDCDRRVIDLATDGENNAGSAPEAARDALTGITVNALAVSGAWNRDTSRNNHALRTLEGYLETFVIRGPDAFVETALEYADFEAAMTRKLLRELNPMVIGTLSLPPPG